MLDEHNHHFEDTADVCVCVCVCVCVYVRSLPVCLMTQQSCGGDLCCHLMVLLSLCARLLVCVWYGVVTVLWEFSWSSRPWCCPVCVCVCVC
jgi:hypothetical protein